MLYQISLKARLKSVLEKQGQVSPTNRPSTAPSGSGMVRALKRASSTGSMIAQGSQSDSEADPLSKHLSLTQDGEVELTAAIKHSQLASESQALNSVMYFTNCYKIKDSQDSPSGRTRKLSSPAPTLSQSLTSPVAIDQPKKRRSSASSLMSLLQPATSPGGSRRAASHSPAPVSKSTEQTPIPPPAQQTSALQQSQQIDIPPPAQ